jgi:tRNA wybutosine-synthesizing protein 1
MKNAKGYAKLIEKAEPTYVEPKAYMHVGFSRLRLGYENMPSHQEILQFASELARETGFEIVDECKDSRAALLSRMRKPIRLADG